jgi:hypothetical protein
MQQRHFFPPCNIDFGLQCKIRFQQIILSHLSVVNSLNNKHEVGTFSRGSALYLVNKSSLYNTNHLAFDKVFKEPSFVAQGVEPIKVRASTKVRAWPRLHVSSLVDSILLLLVQLTTANLLQYLP